MLKSAYNTQGKNNKIIKNRANSLVEGLSPPRCPPVGRWGSSRSSNPSMQCLICTTSTALYEDLRVWGSWALLVDSKTNQMSLFNSSFFCSSSNYRYRIHCDTVSRAAHLLCFGPDSSAIACAWTYKQKSMKQQHHPSNFMSNSL